MFGFNSKPRYPRAYNSRGRLGEFIRMTNATYVRTAYGFIKVAPEVASILTLRFAVYRVIITFVALVALAGWVTVVIR